MTSNYGVPGYENPYLIKIPTDTVEGINRIKQKIHPHANLKEDYPILQELIEKSQKYEEEMKIKETDVKEWRQKIKIHKEKLNNLESGKERAKEKIFIKGLISEYRSADQERIKLNNKIFDLQDEFKEGMKRALDHDKYLFTSRQLKDGPVKEWFIDLDYAHSLESQKIGRERRERHERLKRERGLSPWEQIIKIFSEKKQSKKRGMTKAHS
jgi:hypothetical protein